jgi:hypothetical protein
MIEKLFQRYLIKRFCKVQEVRKSQGFTNWFLDEAGRFVVSIGLEGSILLIRVTAAKSHRRTPNYEDYLRTLTQLAKNVPMTLSFDLTNPTIFEDIDEAMDKLGIKIVENNDLPNYFL